ncbi:MAG: DUF1844 domain-containing protein [Phycisphaeraceae bacterium]|nr:DUF1844 domain-containing protein [Phycisphaerae bacterium]MBX3391678.1 DUF1844 domain-containing protein [Phycisphaeraceae bacterium]
MPDGEAPKIIIDTDWKSQAQAEKERLSQAAAPRPHAGGSASGAPSSPGDPAGSSSHASAPDQEIGFQDLVRVLVTQALSYMGAFPDPRTGKAVVAVDMARVFIDLLGVLEEKTKGNLTPEESTLVSRTLNELRLEWVDLNKAIAKAVEEGKIQPSAAPIPGAGPGMSAAPGIPGTPDLKLKF